ARGRQAARQRHEGRAAGPTTADSGGGAAAAANAGGAADTMIATAHPARPGVTAGIAAQAIFTRDGASARRQTKSKGERNRERRKRNARSKTPTRASRKAMIHGAASLRRLERP